MPKLIFHSLVALLLVVSCECKDMHVRRMPDEKDIVFEGEVEKPQKAVYRKGQSRAIQVHLTSSDEEAKDAQFKILSATLADGSPADVDYDTLKLGDNTLSYTPKGPGTHALTIKVAVEGEEAHAQTIHYTLEAPAANWQVRGTADATGNLTIQIADVPEELQGEQWRITSMTFSEGLEGRIENMPTRLNHGANNLNVILDQIVLQEEASHVVFTIQGPDGSQRDDQVDLTTLCVAQLKGDMSVLDRNLADRLLVVNDEHETETEKFFTRDEEGIYHLPEATVTDPRVNREKQAEIEERLNLMERDLEAYDRDLQRLEALEVQDPTHPSRQLPMFRRGKQRLKDAIASLKSAQIQLQQQCTSAHKALFKMIENNPEAIETLLEDPELDVNGRNENETVFLTLLGDPRFDVNGTNEQGYSLLHVAAGQGNDNFVKTLLEKEAAVNAKNLGFSPLYIAAQNGQDNVVQTLLNNGARVNEQTDFGCAALHRAAYLGHNDVVKTLLEKGAAVNLKDKNGCTPLHEAAQGGRDDVVKTLLEKGAAVNATDNEKWTPLRTAKNSGHNSIVTLLEGASAR